jgi:hypothetical protein
MDDFTVCQENGRDSQIITIDFIGGSGSFSGRIPLPIYHTKDQSD